MSGVFNLLSSRTNLHLSYNPAGRSHCRLQNLHGYIKYHHRGMGGSPCNVGEVPMTQVKQRKGCRMSGASFFNPYIASPTSQLILQPYSRFTYITAHSTSLPLLHLHHRYFTYVTAHSPTLPPLHLRHSSFYNPSASSPTSQVILQLYRCFTYVTGTSRMSPGEPPLHREMKKQYVVDQLVTAIYEVQKQLQFWIVVKNFTTSSKLIFLQSYSVQ